MDSRMSGSGDFLDGVHAPLVWALGDCSDIRVLVVDRFSKDDRDGLESQVARHMSLYSDDDDVREYLALIDTGIFGNDAGIIDDRVGFISPAHIHPLAAASVGVRGSHRGTRKGHRHMVAYAKVGRTLFLRVMLNATQSEIEREDGSRDNVYTTLLLSLLKCLDGLEEVRWGVDPTRAARDRVNWALLMRRHQERNVAMTFAGQRHDLTQKSDRLKLSVLGVMSAEDDPDRRRKLVESRLVRYQRGEFCLPADLMPYGWSLPKNHRGVVAKGTLPVGDFGACEPLKDFYTMFADGAPSRKLVERLAYWEAEGRFPRRSGLKYVLTFADALACADAPMAQSVIVQRMLRPLFHPKFPAPTRPSQDHIDAYVAGGDPALLFDLPQRMTISRIEAIRTGNFLRVLRNDIKQRGIVLAGVPATCFDPGDEAGFFFTESHWPFPIDPVTGHSVERFGIPDDVLRRAGARVLAGLNGPRTRPTGGQAHQRAERRPFMNFGRWIHGEFAYEAGAAPGAKEGLVNTVIRRRDASIEGSWGHQRRCTNESTVATFRQQALALAVSDAIAVAMQERLTMEPIAPASSLAHDKARSTAEAEASRLRDRAAQAQTEAERAEAKSRGAREMASLLVADGEIARARQYERDAAEGDSNAALLRAEADRLVAKAARAALSADAQAMADVTATAYLIAGLRQAASTGKVIDEVGQVADRMLRDWTLVPVENEDARAGKWINFTVNLVVPLVGRPDELLVPLTGQVPNVRRPRKSPSTVAKVDVIRTAWNPRSRDHACELFFGDGKTLDEVSLWTRIPVKSFLANHLPIWLRDHGIRNSILKGALIDHPFASVRQVVFEAVTGQTGRLDLSGHDRAWRDHVVSVYRDPMLQWGCAACPDDLLLEHAVMDYLAINGTTSRSEIHAEFGVSTVRSRQLVTPKRQTPKRGLARPQYVAWGDSGKKSLSLISCPHDGCTGVAARAVLLPETAVSGFGAVCTTCRRLPNAEDPKWGSIVFPEEYIKTRWTSGPRHPRPLTGRTVSLPIERKDH